jgi:uncharacterized membrane protein HdeD (DUF308 family)
LFRPGCAIPTNRSSTENLNMSTTNPTPEPASPARSSNFRTPAGGPVAQAFCHELAHLQSSWLWFLVLGVGWIVLGAISLSCAPFATFVTVAMFGVIMLIGGVGQIVGAFWAGKWSGFLLQVLIGILYAVVGFVVMDAPEKSAIALTLVMAIFLIVGGIVRIVVALFERFTGWGWVLLNGAVALLLGLLIRREWPLSGLMVIGLYVGIEMVFNGWYWVMLGIGLKKLPQVECGD